jgi:hypothetical protein
VTGARAILAGTIAAIGIAMPAATPAATGTRILGQVELHDAASVMQGFARTGPTGSWITTQVMQTGRFGLSHAYHLAHGDLTLTHLSATGKTVFSWMYLRGFGHGQVISLQPRDGGGFWVWAEAVSKQGPGGDPNGFGTQIARFKWVAGRTITPTSAGVRLYDPHPGTWRNSAQLSPGGGQIAVHYTSGDGGAATDVYGLEDFLAHRYNPVLHIPHPAGLPPYGQGWALMPTGDRIAWYTGTAYSAASPPPGNTRITVYGTGGVISQTFITDGLGLTFREPEGIQVIGGRLCYGFASGPASGRRASVYCQ